jgi:hypothetical protein
MQIRVAHAGGLQFHQRFSVAWGGKLQFGDLQRGTEFGDHGGAHGVGCGVGRGKGAEGLSHGFIPIVKRVEVKGL